MKKLSSFLVLMLIALTLFVSCNGSTPTKEESNSSSNGSTPTVTERAATDADYTLFATLSNVLMNDIVSNRIKHNVGIPEGCTREQDDSTNTISLTFNSCEFDSYNLDGSPLHVKLNGSATIKRDQANSVDYYTWNFTEGSSLGNTIFTINLEFSTNNSGINFTTATINGFKINGLSELANRKYSREATDEDKELTKKLISILSYLETLSSDEITALNNNTPGEINKYNNNTNTNAVVYTFNNWQYVYSGTNYLLNGGVELIRMDSNTFTINCNFLNNGTKIDGVYHSIMAGGTKSVSTENCIYDFQNAVIDFTSITNLVVEVPERVATDADGKLISAIYIATKDLFNNSNPNNLTFNGYSFPVMFGESEVFNLILVGSATKTEEDGNIKYEYDLKDGTKISVRDLKDGTTISDVPHTVNASFTKNNTIVVKYAIIDGTKVNYLDDKMKPYL